ncbi:MAG: DUF1631 family protein [Gammaproteobacteria bacterium]|nr:DUF1631 family protein [Gammaproteobacteria bacterium]NIR83718.1 DUF1631 family protein [Gammaproteobacteria bacterium]NIR91865.1 DUF1631 family protein [Gammaproteobacteria bacterium]NIU04884.1 DUF1631 family protein [Gammaproteobacteria bacterium]NIV51866.1 DUF1631 family protein [Gammaproteobacteria bacterium]
MEHERRRHTRHPISLPATIIAPNGDAHEAVIKDFCLGGLFVACRELVEPASGRRIGEEAPLRLSFVLPVEGRDESFEVFTQVARVLSDGIGVHFTDADVSTLKALRALATHAKHTRRKSEAAARLAVPSETVVSGVDAGILDASRALFRCKGMVADYLTANIEALYKRADDKLSQACADAIGTAEEGRYFHAMWELNNLQSTIHMSLRADVLSRFDELMRHKGRRPSGLEDTDDIGDLSLVDTQSFSDWLAIKEILQEASAQTAESSAKLEGYLTQLLRTSVDENTNPVSPIGICAAFHDAVHGLWLSPVAREPLFQSFRETLIANLDGLYAELNAVLEEHGVSGAGWEQGAAAS